MGGFEGRDWTGLSWIEAYEMRSLSFLFFGSEFDSWIPASADKEDRLRIMSIQFLLPNKDDAIVWRGPKKNGEGQFEVVCKCLPSS